MHSSEWSSYPCAPLSTEADRLDIPHPTSRPPEHPGSGRYQYKEPEISALNCLVDRVAGLTSEGRTRMHPDNFPTYRLQRFKALSVELNACRQPPRCMQPEIRRLPSQHLFNKGKADICKMNEAMADATARGIVLVNTFVCSFASRDGFCINSTAASTATRHGSPPPPSFTLERFLRPSAAAYQHLTSAEAKHGPSEGIPP